MGADYVNPDKGRTGTAGSEPHSEPEIALTLKQETIIRSYISVCGQVSKNECDISQECENLGWEIAQCQTAVNNYARHCGDYDPATCRSRIQQGLFIPSLVHQPEATSSSDSNDSQRSTNSSNNNSTTGSNSSMDSSINTSSTPANTGTRATADNTADNVDADVSDSASNSSGGGCSLSSSHSGSYSSSLFGVILLLSVMFVKRAKLVKVRK